MSTIYVGVNYTDKLIKAVSDKDCLPTQVHKVAEFVSTADMSIPKDNSERFYYYYDKMRWLERLGFHVIIDFGERYYETGEGVTVPSKEG